VEIVDLAEVVDLRILDGPGGRRDSQTTRQTGGRCRYRSPLGNARPWRGSRDSWCHKDMLSIWIQDSWAVVVKECVSLAQATPGRHRVAWTGVDRRSRALAGRQQAESCGSGVGEGCGGISG
jgi:hypothetical protein